MDLKKNAPKGEFLAYINKEEAAMLKKAGGSGKLVNGIPSFKPQDFGDQAKGTGAYTGGGKGGANFNASNKGGPKSVDRSRVSIEQQINHERATGNKERARKDAYREQQLKAARKLTGNQTFSDRFSDVYQYGKKAPSKITNMFDL